MISGEQSDDFELKLIPDLMCLNTLKMQQHNRTSTFPPVLEEVMRKVPLMMPSIHVLELELLYCPPPLILDVILSLPLLQSLTVAGKAHISSPDGPVALLNLQYLTIYTSTSLLSSIEIPQLLVLDIYDRNTDPKYLPLAPKLRSLSIPASMISAFKQADFPELRELRWISCDVGCAFASIGKLSLKKLRFQDAYLKEKFEGDMFCEILARHPSACPQLEEIAFGLYPDWSVLLYMLARRSEAAARFKISSIKTIHLATYPAPFLLLPLTQLLGEYNCIIPTESAVGYPWRTASDPDM